MSRTRRITTIVVVLAACSGAPSSGIAGDHSKGQEEALIFHAPDCVFRYDRQLGAAGFLPHLAVEGDLVALRVRLGVPERPGNCHVMFVGDYFVDGPVPLSAVRRLLRDRPDLVGLAAYGDPLHPRVSAIPRPEKPPAKSTGNEMEGGNEGWR